jgi:DNA gyrase/topoisomerase IV subunit B
LFGDRLIATGGAKLVGALAIACLLLAALLVISVIVNVRQFNGATKLALDLGGKLAASEAKGQAEAQACKDTKVRMLGDELHACRGEHQRIDEQFALALRQRDRARTAAEAERAQREEVIRRIYETNSDCRAWADGAVCRAVSDELLRAAPAPESR